MPPHGSQTANAIRQDLSRKGHVVTWVVALGWRLREHLSRCRTWSGESGTRSTLTGAPPTAHLGGHPEGGRTRGEGYPARARTPRGLAWKLGELEGHPSRGPSHLWSPPASLLSRSGRVLLMEPGSVFADPRPFTEQSEGWRAVSADLTGADWALGSVPHAESTSPISPALAAVQPHWTSPVPRTSHASPQAPPPAPLPMSLPSVRQHPLSPPISAPASFSREVLLTLCPPGPSFTLLSTADKVMNVRLVLCPPDAGPCAQAAVHTVGAH